MSADQLPRGPSELADLAAMVAAGAASADETAWFEELLRTGDTTAVAAWADLSPVVEALSDATAPVAPPPSVRDRLMDRIGRGHDQTTDDAKLSRPASDPSYPSNRATNTPQVWRQWDPSRTSDQKLTIVRAGDGPWEETGVPGVRVKRLIVDPSRDQFTAIVQMDPGAAWPKHVHNGPEECLVLKGELHVGDTVLREGDYQFAPPESLHGVQRTDGGCLLLITSSLSDEHV